MVRPIGIRMPIEAPIKLQDGGDRGKILNIAAHDPQLWNSVIDVWKGIVVADYIHHYSETDAETMYRYMETFLGESIKGMWEAYKGRKKILKMLKRMLEERKSQPRKEQSDFFDYVLEELQSKDTILTEGIALDLMFVLLFVSFETTSWAITLAIKFLHEHPQALKELKEEHEAIIKRRENASYGLTWQEYKSMKFTFQFINETVRLANIAPALFRKTLKEINFKGYTIPAGWAIMVYSQAVHLNPAKYEDPLQFNPWRWEGIELNGTTRNFMAFGGGIRYCIGADFAKVQMAIFLHCFVTKYK
ncbi:hypothetical protein MTR67_033962 [Solanum verrucosum]|uniref:Cytochrome P450 n=1 Tax=Solanum verrucosum TaxID=315347 RepID=A0AAF0ZIS9_SOLVR|nr:hypothetical protein MTR67_033962 [Solanum verrucosum]